MLKTAHGGDDQFDRLLVRKSAHSLAELCKQDASMDVAVREGAISITVPLLNLGAPRVAQCDCTRRGSI